MLEFQIYDWMEDHELDVESDSESSNENENEQYIIHTFGRTIEGKSVYMRIINYTPHFYIMLPLNWTKNESQANVKKMYQYLTSDMNRRIPAKFRASLTNIDLVERLNADGFTNEKLYLFGRLIFNNSIAMNKYRYLFDSNIYIPGVTIKPIQFKPYESNLVPMLRCFHIRKISGCSWVSITKYIDVDIMDKESHCDIEVRVDWRNINPITKQQNAPLRIMSFDIECYSIDGGFPQAERDGDHITMIGSTYTYLGESTPYRQHIVCLNKTSNLDNIIVESYDTERDMLIGWFNEIKNSDCDIMTGYNIFFFDEAYIHDRGIKNNIVHEMIKLSKLKNYECKFRDFKLASSALGENRIRMFDTPGRIHIDLMKDIQKNHKLSSFKLDNVASTFIRDIIQSIAMSDDNKNFILKCDAINDIVNNDYIHIEIVSDYISDMIGGKYVIKSIDTVNKTMMIDVNDDMLKFIESNDYKLWLTQSRKERKFKLWWSQAKDDIEVKQIFKMSKGTPDDRAIIAKYCIKDCKLVNLLMDKLNIVTNNIEMSNVCYVPLSFLFTRGQTIKAFSLLMKEFRENNYLFPVIKKPDLKLPSYEGAAVIEPEPCLMDEALSVNDFASLYPTVAIEMNMSHETMPKNDSYNDSQGVTWNYAKYRDHDGSIQYRRFARKDKMGVIPTILTNLLNERSIVKKQLKNEKNHFTAKILDGKQLALKVTANSLYGALGADVCPLFNRDIAACITAVGRERLKLARNYVENIVPRFFNGLQIAWSENDNSKADKIINNEVTKRDDKLITRLKTFLTSELNNYIYQPIVRYGDTDSIFTCYRFRENMKRITTEDSIKLWKDVIDFSKKIVLYFLSDDDKDIFTNIFDNNYTNIDDLSIPAGPSFVNIILQSKITLPKIKRMEQFILKYMDEQFLSFIWTLQDIFNKSYIDENVKNNMIEDRLFKTMYDMIETFGFTPEYLDDIDKNIVTLYVEKFISKKLKYYMILPYWDIIDNKFVTKVRIYKKCEKITDKRCLKLSIEMGVLTGEFIKNRLPSPHDCKYEKTFWPFLILTKKRYVGNKYEEDPDKYKQDYNGIVLKRRDNAPIVKEICGGIIKYLIDMRDPAMAKQFTIESMRKMFNNNYNIKYFLTTKTLKSKESYKCKDICNRSIEQKRIEESGFKTENKAHCNCETWKRIAHVVLADRIAQRNPGNCPQAGDRIEFTTVVIPNLTKTTLQGERIETPQYIKDNNLSIDYEFYMTNQIMNPALQFLSLVIPDAKSIFDEFKIEKKKIKKNN
jgi:DNA polymerase elongation subunit (family B)